MLQIQLPAISDTLYWWINASSVFLVSCALAWVIIPRILLIAFKKRLFDPLDERKLHKQATPRLGGIAFAPILMFAIAFLIGINLLLGKGDIVLGLCSHASGFTFGLCAGFLLYLVGISDDLIGVRYRTKFAIQALSGILLASAGLSIHSLHGLFGIHTLPPVAGYLLTVVVVVFIINALNLIDGIDGLASGLSGIALCYYGILFMQRELYIYALLAFATLGTLVPFFCYNVFGNAKRGRRLFMGDTGSLTIGIILSMLSIVACLCPTPCTADYNAFILAFIPLTVPCFDVLRVFLHRVRNGCSPFKPDRNHIHHKLLDAGLSARQALVVILASAAVLIAVNILCSPLLNVNVLLVGNILVWTLINMRLTAFMKQKANQQPRKQ